jgi:hypothetical protein
MTADDQRSQRTCSLKDDGYIDGQVINPTMPIKKILIKLLALLIIRS